MLNASACAPWTPVFELIAVDIVSAALESEDRFVEKSEDKALKPFIFTSAIPKDAEE